MDRFHALLNEDESDERGERIASFLLRLSPKTSLDVGCSSGFLVKALRTLGVEAFGIDVDESRFLHDVRGSLFVADAGKDVFPFLDSRFDLVTAFTSLDYVPNPRHALDEIGRVLKKGGYLVMSFATDPRMKFDVRPNVFPTQVWIDQLSKRGFSSDAKMAQDYDWEIGVRPEIANSPAEHVPRAMLTLWRKARGTSFGCVVARLNQPTTPSEAGR